MGTNDLSGYFKYDDFKKLFENDSVFLDKLFDNIKKLCEMALRTNDLMNAMVILGTITARQCEEQMPSCDPLRSFRSNCSRNENVLKLPRYGVYDILKVKSHKKVGVTELFKKI
jgi:hypothetical protein